MLVIINAAAQAYRGVIPADRWHEPYMSAQDLREDIDAGVVFWGYESDGRLLGVMGLQAVHDVELIRHAYVLPECQGMGIGGALLGHLLKLGTQRVFVGTWADASWAIDFYQRHGFQNVPRTRVKELLRRYWSVPERQIEVSVVLAKPSLE